MAIVAANIIVIINIEEIFADIEFHWRVKVSILNKVVNFLWGHTAPSSAIETYSNELYYQTTRGDRIYQ